MHTAPYDLMVVEKKYSDFSLFAHEVSLTHKLFPWPG